MRTQTVSDFYARIRKVKCRLHVNVPPRDTILRSLYHYQFVSLICPEHPWSKLQCLGQWHLDLSDVLNILEYHNPFQSFQHDFFYLTSQTAMINGFSASICFVNSTIFDGVIWSAFVNIIFSVDTPSDLSFVFRDFEVPCIRTDFVYPGR